MKAMTRVPWYYIWSEKYEIFHTIFQDTVTRLYPNISKEFSIRPIYLEQSEFTKKLNTDQTTHPFKGCNIKIDTLINFINANMNNYFIFSDIDIIVKQPDIRQMIDKHLKHDMTFMSEDKNSKAANIGFCLIKATKETLEFWKQVQRLVLEESGHDQDIVNLLLKTTKLKTALFSEIDIVSQKTCTKDTNFKIVQILSTGGNSVHWQLIEKIRIIPFFINIAPYKYLISEQQIKDIQYFSSKLN